MPPKVLAKPGSERPGGVLPINVAARTPRAPKPPAARLKLEVRRLPPGLTLAEFEEILGEEWKLGAGRVDWREFRAGRVRSPGKLPEQSRCYLHLKSEAEVKPFEAKFLSVVFHDAAGTHKLQEIRHLPPTLGFAPNQRVPLPARPRVDNRQGTIDTDAEFIAFLEAETQPITKPAAVDVVFEKEDKVKTTSTPLIDDLRERKAHKAKKAEKGKDKKKGAGKDDAKSTSKAGKGETSGKSGKGGNKQEQQAPATAKNATPAKGKKGNAQTPKGQGNAQNQPKDGPAANQPAAKGQRQRGNNTEGIKKMLQKDLGIKPAKGNAQKSESTPNRSTTQSPSTAQNTNTQPAGSNKPAQKQGRQAAAQTISTTKAYLKHANPSQGMTEILIQNALASFGDMVSVTIDPRKGTAIAVFKDAEGLKKALQQKKVEVAQGAIEVLEYRERNTGGNSGGGGAGAGGGGGGGGGGGRGGRGAGKGGRSGRGGKGGANAASAGGSGSAAPTAAPASAPAPAPASAGG